MWFQTKEIWAIFTHGSETQFQVAESYLIEQFRVILTLGKLLCLVGGLDLPLTGNIAPIMGRWTNIKAKSLG